MNNRKIAWNNAKRNFHIYSAYFITIMISVALFYSFNSLSFTDTLYNKDLVTEFLVAYSGLINGTTIILSVVLSLILIYSGNFLFKKRSGEFSTYLILGMDREELIKMLLLESSIIALFALLIGIILGFVISQFIIIFIFTGFNIDIGKYKLFYSMRGTLKTILIFSVIYILTSFINIIRMKKKRIITLIDYKNSDSFRKVVSKKEKIVFTILSILFYFLFLYLTLYKNVYTYSKGFILAIVSVIIAQTLLVFYGYPLILTILREKWDNYYRGLSPFVLGTLSKYIKESKILILVSSFIMAIGLILLNFGIGANNGLKHYKTLTPNLDIFTIFSNRMVNRYVEPIQVENLDMTPFSNDYIKMPLYKSDISYKDIEDIGYTDKIAAVDARVSFEKFLLVIPLSYFNKAMEISKQEPISLDKGEALIFLLNHDETYGFHREFKKGKIKTQTMELSVNRTIDRVLGTQLVKSASIIVNDDEIKDKRIESFLVLGNFINNDEEIYDKYKKYLTENYSKKYKDIDYLIMLRDENMARIAQLSSLGVLITTFMGSIFLLSACAILTIGILSLINMDKDNFNTMRKLGSDDGSIKNSILKLIVIFFSLAIIPALLLSHTLIKFYWVFVNNNFGISDIKCTLISVTLMLIFVNMIYIALTYVTASKNQYYN